MKRFTETGTFDDPWYQELSVVHKVFWKFITEKCDSTGVWKENLRLASFLIGDALDKESILEAFDGRIEVHKEGYWFVPDFIEFQYGTLSEKCNPHKPILKLLAKHLSKGIIPKAFLNPSHTLPTTLPERVSDTLKEKDKEKDKEEVQEEEEVQEKTRDVNSIAERIAKLVESWSPHLNYGEQSMLADNLPKWQALSEDDWAILAAWYADTSDRTKYRTRRKSRLLECVDEELAKAKDAGFSANSLPRLATTDGPSWMPPNWREIGAEITGKPVDELRTYADIPPAYRFKFESTCKGLDGGEDAA